jgi:Protein of unknown function (DUF3800)
MELKFSHIGRTKSTPKNRNWMIHHAGLHEVEKRRALVFACLRAFVTTPTVKVQVVVIDQDTSYVSDSPIIYAIQPLFERINMDCQTHQTNGLVVCDEEEAQDKALRQMTRGGSYFMNFDRLVDTISFMPSDESVGVQIADLIAGSFSRYLNDGDPGFARILWPALRRSYYGHVNGYGIKFLPSGSCPVPPSEKNPLPEFDAKVAELEREAREKLETGGQ